jgi:hypothetical protein
MSILKYFNLTPYLIDPYLIEVNLVRVIYMTRLT